jgi:Ulp1 family protease
MKNKNLQYVSTLFFAKLKEGPAEIKIVNGEEERVPTVLSGSKISFDMIDRWVKKKNYCYVEKDVVLFPINYLKSHWYLVTFIRPNLLFMRNADSEEQQPLRNAYSEEQQPFVLILDSLPTKNKTNYHDTVNALKEFFYICWLKRTKLNDTDLEATQLKRILLEEVPTVFPDCPLQPNFDDCGVHVAKHIKNIAIKYQYLTLKKVNGKFELDYNLCEDLTPDVSSERKYHMYQLMKEIEEKQVKKVTPTTSIEGNETNSINQGKEETKGKVVCIDC